MSSQTGLQAGTGAKGSKKGRGADDHDESDVKGEEDVSGKKKQRQGDCKGRKQAIEEREEACEGSSAI